MVLRYYLIVLLVVTLFIENVRAESLKHITIAQTENQLIHTLGADVLVKAYKRLGINVDFVLLPNSRSLATANSGKVDGEIGRLVKVLDKVPNLLMAREVPIASVIAVAVTNKAKCDCEKWSDLKDLTIGIIRGEIYAERATKGMSVFMMKGYPELFTMLERGRVDVVIGILSSVELELQTSFKNSGLKIVGKELLNLPLYHLLHKKHQSLIPKLNKVLMEMKMNGEIEKSHQETIKKAVNERNQNK